MPTKQEPAGRPAGTQGEAASLVIQPAKEVPCDLCRRRRITSFDHVLPKQLGRDPVLHSDGLDSASQVPVYGPGRLVEVVRDPASAQHLVRNHDGDVIGWLVAFGDQTELLLKQYDRLAEPLTLVPNVGQLAHLRLADRRIPSIAEAE